MSPNPSGGDINNHLIWYCFLITYDYIWKKKTLFACAKTKIQNSFTAMQADHAALEKIALSFKFLYL